MYVRALSTQRCCQKAGETKMAKPLIFLAAVGATFNRHLRVYVYVCTVDTAQVVSSWSSANIAFPSAWCVRECRPAWNFPRSPPSNLPPRFPSLSRGWRFALESNRKRARRRPAAADGLNNRRRENELERKKKSDRSAPWVRDTSRYRRVVVDRSFDDPGRRKIQLVPGRLCERGWTGADPEQTRGWIANWPGYRCIFNTETKRYNPRLIGKLHLGRPPSPIQIAGVRYRGYTASFLPRRQDRRAANLFSLAATLADSNGRVVYVRNNENYYFVYLDKWVHWIKYCHFVSAFDYCKLKINTIISS